MSTLGETRRMLSFQVNLYGIIAIVWNSLKNVQKLIKNSDSIRYLSMKHEVSMDIVRPHFDETHRMISFQVNLHGIIATGWNSWKNVQRLIREKLC